MGINHLLAMENDRFIGMCSKVFTLNLLHLRIYDAGNIPQFKNNTSKTQKLMVWIFLAFKVRVSHFININTIFHSVKDIVSGLEI